MFRGSLRNILNIFAYEICCLIVGCLDKLVSNVWQILFCSGFTNTSADLRQATSAEFKAPEDATPFDSQKWICSIEIKPSVNQIFTSPNPETRTPKVNNTEHWIKNKKKKNKKTLPLRWTKRCCSRRANKWKIRENADTKIKSNSNLPPQRKILVLQVHKRNCTRLLEMPSQMWETSQYVGVPSLMIIRIYFDQFLSFSFKSFVSQHTFLQSKWLPGKPKISKETPSNFIQSIAKSETQGILLG